MAQVEGKVSTAQIHNHLEKSVTLSDCSYLPGEDRIASELLVKLGIQVSPRTVRKYIPKRPDGQLRGDQRWSTS